MASGVCAFGFQDLKIGKRVARLADMRGIMRIPCGSCGRSCVGRRFRFVDSSQRDAQSCRVAESRRIVTRSTGVQAHAREKGGRNCTF